MANAGPLMASFAMFGSVFKTYEEHHRPFCVKEILKTFLIPKFVIDTLSCKCLKL